MPMPVSYVRERNRREAIRIRNSISMKNTHHTLFSLLLFLRQLSKVGVVSIFADGGRCRRRRWRLNGDDDVAAMRE